MTSKAPPPGSQPAQADSDFPVHAYRCPGPHNAGELGSYDYRSANNQQELNRLFERGWSKSIPDAAEKYAAEKAKSK